MTVGELIKVLEKFPKHLVVVMYTQDETLEPAPYINIHYFDTSYYTGKEFIKLPKDVEFVSL